MNPRLRSSARFTRKALPAAMAMIFGQAWGQAINSGGNAAHLPTNGVAANPASVSVTTLNASTMALAISGRAIIDWSTFNIGAGKAVNFTGDGGAVLNRVAGGDSLNASTIAGALNGQKMAVMLMNPNGIAFTSTAVVNVGALVATTGTIDQSAFLSTGNAVITGATSGSITVSAGAQIAALGKQFTASNAGLVALVAPSVVNHGIITAVGGKILLAGAQATTITMNDGLYEFAIGQGVANNKVENTGTLTTADVTEAGPAAGGTIILSAPEVAGVLSGAINLTGIQRANRIEVHGKDVVLSSDLDATTVTGTSSRIEVGQGAQLQDAVAIAKSSGATVDVVGGEYSGTVTLNKANMTVTGSDEATLSIAAGENGFVVTANNVTLEGMNIVGPHSTNFKDLSWGAVPTTNAAVSVQNNVSGATIRNNTIRNVRTGITLLGNAPNASITGNTIDNTKGAILVRSNDTNVTIDDNHKGANGSEWDIVFMSNIADGQYFASHSDLVQYGRDVMAMSADNHGMRILDRRYTSANRSHVDVKAGTSFTAADDFGLGNGLGNARQPLATIVQGLAAAVDGGFVDLGAGTYTQSAQLDVTRPVTLRGSGQGGANATIIDASALSSGYGMLVTADNVSLSEFTFLGPTANRSNAYGIKVQPHPNLTDPNSRVRDFRITNVTSRGAGRAELDLNGVVGATIDGVTADGAGTQGAGIQITDSANVLITRSTTHGNVWGGVALFQGNRFYNQQTTGIKVEAGNDFQEANPLYLQRDSVSAQFEFGSLELRGFEYAVRNPTVDGTRKQAEYVWMQKDAPRAFDLAVSLGTPNASYAQAWNGTEVTQNFVVGVGQPAAGGAPRAMSIQTAVDHAAAGAQIDIYPGSYVESVANRTSQGVQVDAAGLFVDKDNLTLRGVDAGGNAITSANDVLAWITAGARSNFGMAHGVVANNVTFDGLGFKPKTDYLNKTIEISGDNFTFRNGVVDNRRAGGTTQAGGGGALYFGELDPVGHQISRLTVTGSKFLDGSVVITEGVGLAADGVTYQAAADRVISGNTFEGSNNYRFGGVLLNGKMDEIGWRTKEIGAVTITGNSFGGFDESVLVRGEQQGVDLKQAMQGNTFDRSVLVTDASGNVRGELYASSASGSAPFVMRPKYSIQSSIQAGVNRAASGDTVSAGKGTYAESVTIEKAIALRGAGMGETVIDPTGAANGIVVKGNIGAGAAVTISDLTVQGGGTGIQVNTPSTALGTLTLERVVVRDNASSGFITGNAVTTVNIFDSVFAGNGGSSNGTAEINLFLFNGTATLRNVDILGTKPVSSAADFGLQIRGEGTTATMFAAGHVTLDDVRIAGNYKKSHLAVQRYSDASNVVMTGVQLGGALTNVDVGVGDPLSVAGSNADWGSFFSSDMRGNLSLGDTVFNGGVFNPLYGDIRIGGVTGGLKVDASGVEFNGLAHPSVATLADYFAMEDRVVHALDALGGEGLVMWKPGNVYVTHNSGSVQRAVAATSVGDTINVTNVSFTEDVTVGTRRNLLFNDSQIGSLSILCTACGSGIGGSVKASGTTGFQFNAPVVLLADTVLDTSAAGRPVSASAIDGTSAGAQKLTIRAGAGLVTLGNLGAATRLGAVDVRGGAMHFTGSSYLASSLLFTGPMTLHSPTTSFQTDGGNIVLNGDIQNAGGSPAALTLDAGAGDVTLVSGGSSGNPLGRLEVDANNFSLQSTLWVSGYDINALGTVALSDHTLRSVGAGVVNEISAGGDVTGSTIAQSGVQIQSDADVAANVVSQGGVLIEAENVTGNYSAPIIVIAAQDTVNVTVTAPESVQVNSGGPVILFGEAPVINLNSPTGEVHGNFGQVNNTGSGLIEVNGRPQLNPVLAETASNNRVVPQEVTTAASPEAGAPQRNGGSTVRRRRKPEDALDVLDNGEAMEIDLTPG